MDSLRRRDIKIMINLSEEDAFYGGMVEREREKRGRKWKRHLRVYTFLAKEEEALDDVFALRFHKRYGTKLCQQQPSGCVVFCVEILMLISAII